MSEKAKIKCCKCGRELGEIDPNTWLIVESPDIDESIEESHSDEEYQFCCNECYKAQIESDRSWEDADGEEPYTRNVELREMEEEE